PQRALVSVSAPTPACSVDRPNKLFQGESPMLAGGGAQTDTSSRWGDYSMMAVDPSDDCSFWYTTEYYAASSDQGWQTRVGKFKFSNCSAAPHGTLQGTVTDAKSGLPIADATVQTANGYLRVTGNAGTYSMSLPPDTYPVTASAPSYRAATSNGVSVANAGTTTQNFALSPVAVLSLSATIIDDSAGNNNGHIDLNECIRLRIRLQNTGAEPA